jgi:hypothetical protein
MNIDIINGQAMPLVLETSYWWAFAFRQWNAERKKDLYSRTTRHRISHTSTRGNRIFVDCVAVCPTSTTNSFSGSAEVKNTWSYTSNPRTVWRLISHSNRYPFQFSTSLLAWRRPIIDYCWGIFLSYEHTLTYRFPTEQDFCLQHTVQTGSEAHQPFYEMGVRGEFPGGKAAGVWSWPLTQI